MEVPVAGSDKVKWARVMVPAQLPPSEPCYPATPDMAGTTACSSPSRSFTIWRIHTSAPAILELFILDDDEAHLSGLQLVFEEPLSPYIAVYSDQVHSIHEEGILSVYAVTISGVLHILKIRAFYKYRSVSTIARSDIMQFSLVSELGRLDQVTALSGAGENVCVGGKSGSILCYPVGSLSVETKDKCFELRDSDAILGRLWGLVARSKNAGSIQSLKLQIHKARTLLFALHEDGLFKLWDLHSRSRLLNFNLYKGDSSGFIPKMMWVQEQDVGSRSTKVAFCLQKEETTTQNAVHIYDLHLDQVDGAGGQAVLQFQSQIPKVQGTVLDLKLLSDRFWKLEVVDGQFHINCYSTKREELLESCELLEAELQDQLFLRPDDDWEELICFQESLNTSSKVQTELQLPVSELFTSKVLQPGVYQQHSLHEVLQKHKRNIPERDFVMLTRQGLQREILAVIETENAEDDKSEHLNQWRDFCMDYFMSWKHSNVPYALMCDHHTGSIGLIRRQCVSFRRSLSNFETVYKGGWSEAKFLDLLFKCTSTIVRQAGRVPCAVFGELLVRNRHISLSHLCSVFLHFLDVGYAQFRVDNGATHIGVDVERRKALEYRQRHRKLGFHLMLDLQHLRDFTGGWNRVLDNIERYIIQITQDSRIFPKDDSSEGMAYGIISKRLVHKSTAQLSRTLFEAAKDLLLLLSYLIKIKGQVGISNNESLRIRTSLIVQVKHLFLRGLLVHWLCINFVEMPPPEDFSLHLSTLQLDNVTAKKPESQQGTRELTLSEILLSACAKNLSKGQVSYPKGILSSDYLLYATKSFTSWLMWGESNGEFESLSSRSVTLAAVLLHHGQYSALEEFLGLVENFCNELELHEPQSSKGNWCARLHLLGCGLLGQTRNGLKEAISKSRVEKAVHYFFRVASVVGQEREDLSLLFSKIGMETNYLVHGAIASWKFHYYEWVMQIFEQNHESEGACQFAYAALQEADDTARSSIIEDTNAVLAIKGRLWANIFKFSLDKRKYKEAYCAIMSNPDKESKFVCLRRFLIVLCEQKAAEVLCGSELPYAEMLERVEQELLLKAQHSDINANPNPFKLLYSFHMQRSNWRRAALYMYVYAVRMKKVGLAEAGLPAQFVLQEQLNSLVAAINALHLLDPMHAWLDLEAVFAGVVITRPSSKRMRVYANNDDGYAMQRRRASYVDIQDLEKEYTLALAKMLLIEADMQLSIHGGDLTPENLVLLLVQAGSYEMAFTVLFQFWKDSALKSELERIFKIMAERWCMRQQDSIVERPLPSHKLLLGSDRKLLLPTTSDEDASIETVKSHVAVATKDVMTSTSTNSLQVCLEKYAKLHPHLLVVVAETLLSIDRLIELPYWLVEMLKGGRKAGGEGMSTAGANPSALFRIYLDYGRVTEAAMLYLEYVKARSNLSPADVIKRKRMCGVWFPYTLVDRLRTCLTEMENSEQVKSLLHLLESSLSAYFEQVFIDSSDLKSLVQN